MLIPTADPTTFLVRLIAVEIVKDIPVAVFVSFPRNAIVPRFYVWRRGAPWLVRMVSASRAGVSFRAAWVEMIRSHLDHLPVVNGVVSTVPAPRAPKHSPRRAAVPASRKGGRPKRYNAFPEAVARYLFEVRPATPVTVETLARGAAFDVHHTYETVRRFLAPFRAEARVCGPFTMHLGPQGQWYEVTHILLGTRVTGSVEGVTVEDA